MPRDTDTHPPLASHPLAEQAVEAYLAGIDAVEPTPIVRKAVRQGWIDDWLGSRERPNKIQVLAVGKAAPRMLWGLVEAGVPFAGIGVAPKGVPAPGVDTFEWLPGEHPTPGPASFAAGRRVMQWASTLEKDAPLLVLVSGGSSSCIEVPAPGWDEARLVARWRELMRLGLPVEEMNRRRVEMSALKGGGLARMLLARTPRVRTWLIQDTDPAHPEAVGSQAFQDDRIPLRVLASDRDLVAAAGLRLATQGWNVYRHAERIHGEAAVEVERFLDALASTPGDRVALVGGGEPTVTLPPRAPPGGRSQHAALAASLSLARRGLDKALFAAFASDGIDGGTDAAGAWTMAADGDPSAAAGLAACDAHRILDARGRLVRMGPTGTNVNDLWVALRP